MTPSSSAARSEVEVIDAPERARTAVHPERRRLLAALREEPDSAAGLARRLGESRQRLNYHLRALEEAGLVELAERRRRGNFEERVLRPVARTVVLDPVLPSGGAEAGPGPGESDRFSAACLVRSAATTIREVGRLARRAEEEGKRLATASLEAEVRVGSPAAMRTFVDELAEAVAEVAARHDDMDAGARAFRVTLGAHPTPDHEDGDRS